MNGEKITLSQIARGIASTKEAWHQSEHDSFVRLCVTSFLYKSNFKAEAHHIGTFDRYFRRFTVRPGVTPSTPK